MLLLLVIVASSLVNSAPFLEDEGSAYISMEPNHGRRQETSDKRAVGEGRRLVFENRRSKTDSFRAAARAPLKDHMDEGALQRRMVWESAIRRERPTSRPDTVLPIGREALKRSSCRALPFIQNVFRKSCAPLKLPNKFCFGQCNSFYVPGLPPGLSQPCTSCAPTRSRRISVPLRCRGGRVWWEEVVLVEECACDAPELGQVGSGEGFLPVT